MGEGDDDRRDELLGAGRDHEPEPADAEEAKKPAPGEAEAGNGAGAEAATCDRLVHGANGVCSRHARAPLCAGCCAAGAVFRRASTSAFLCSNCDFGRHRDGGDPPLHDRCAVQPYSGCPPASDLAALLAVPLFDKPAAEDGAWWNIWEEPQVLSLEDLIVPTTPCHGFEPLLTPPSPKNRSISPDRKVNEEILRQLGELAESDGGMQASAGREEAEQAGGDQFPSWASPQYATGHGNFGTEDNHENGRWNNSEYHDLNDACKLEVTYDQAPVNSAEPCLSSFAPLSEICPSMSNGSSKEDNHQANPGIGMPMQGLPKRSGFDVVPCPDRDSVISRYKAKRKTRRFDRQVRYESRKVRADGRLRIKGRFAKANQT
uniref:CCT domain-containing protein n=1 Tax=Zea mays TaxID=4577 RepID=A0A804LKA4_MAIZE